MSIIANPTAPLSLVSTRPRFTYDVPEAARLFSTDPKEITFEPLTLGQEKQALQASSTAGALGYELAKHALVAADGKPITWENAGKDKFLEELSPPCRQLVLHAYDDIHNPSMTVKEAFLKGRRTAV
jgi:hypothetical protein